MKYEYRVDEVAEGEPYEGQDVELLIPGTLIAACEAFRRGMELIPM